MADDLDKFVLQYTVELKDSISRLEKLKEKMDKVDTQTSKTGANLKEFAKGTADEFDRLIPGLSSVAAAVGKMGGAFAIAATAVGALGAGITAVLNLREQMNQQRGDSLVTGLSGARIEDMTRKLSREGGGYVSRQQAAEGMRSFFDMSNQANRNPLDIGVRRRLASMGVDPNSTPLEQLQQLAQKTQGMDDAHLQGLARANGLDIDWVRSMARVGPSGVSNIGMSEKEVNTYNDASEGVSKLNTEMQEFHNQTTKLSQSLGEHLLPGITKILEVINFGMSHTKVDQGGPGQVIIGYNDIGQPIYGDAGPSTGSPGNDRKDYDRELQRAQEAQRKSDQKKANDAAEKQDLAAAQGVKTQNAMFQAVNMFAGAVGQFSNAIDIKQAWAAWAGEAGRASGIKGASGTTGSVTMQGGGAGTWKDSQYRDLIGAAAKKYGLDPQMMYAIMMTESHGMNGQTSPTGARGLMQITRGNWKAYGAGRDAMDPAANFDVGARIWKESLARANGDVAKALVYYNGNSDPNYVSKVAGHYGASGAGIGASRDMMLVQGIQKQIASNLGLSDWTQIARGGATKGDTQFSVSQLEAADLNSITQLQAQLKNPMLGMNDSAKAQINRQLRDTQVHLANLVNLAPGIIDAQKAGNDRTDLTNGKMVAPVNVTNNFTITGNVDAKTLADQINKQLALQIQHAQNYLQTNEKG
jgi:soluble lytic murein transglycosylase-like protein